MKDEQNLGVPTDEDYGQLLESHNKAQDDAHDACSKVADRFVRRSLEDRWYFVVSNYEMGLSERRAKFIELCQEAYMRSQ
jgi:hypothetical protein